MSAHGIYATEVPFTHLILNYLFLATIMEDPDSMEVFLDQLDEPFDNEDQEQDSFFQSSQSQSQKNDDLHLKAAPTTKTTQSQNSQEKSPEVAKERLSIFHHLKSCPGNNVSFSRCGQCVYTYFFYELCSESW